MPPSSHPCSQLPTCITSRLMHNSQQCEARSMTGTSSAPCCSHTQDNPQCQRLTLLSQLPHSRVHSPMSFPHTQHQPAIHQPSVITHQAQTITKSTPMPCQVSSTCSRHQHSTQPSHTNAPCSCPPAPLSPELQRNKESSMHVPGHPRASAHSRLPPPSPHRRRSRCSMRMHPS